MSAQLSIKRNRLKLWLVSELELVNKKIGEVVSSSMGTHEILFEVSTLEYRRNYIQSQINKLSKK